METPIRGFFREIVKYPKSCEFYVNSAFLTSSISWTFLGAYALTTVAAPGAISLKRSFNLGRGTRGWILDFRWTM